MTDGEDFSAFEQTVNEPPADPPALVEDLSDPGIGDNGEIILPPEGEEPSGKPKKTAQERIDELTAKRREAEREAKYFKDLYEGRAKPNGGPPPAEVAKAPDPKDYDFGSSDEKYIEAVIDFRVKEGLDKAEGRMAQSLHVQAAERAWEAKQDAARSEYADYDEKVTAGAHNWPCTPEMAEAIRTSDVGGKLAYHLASNPEEARRLVGLSPYAQVREIGKIEASLETAKPETAKTTNAPKPPGNQARGAGGHYAADGSTTDFAAFEALAKRSAR